MRFTSLSPSNLINGVAYLYLSLYISRLLRRLLHDRSMRRQSLTAFVFRRWGQFNVSLWLLVPPGIIDLEQGAKFTAVWRSSPPFFLSSQFEKADGSPRHRKVGKKKDKKSDKPLPLAIRLLTENDNQSCNSCALGVRTTYATASRGRRTPRASMGVHQGRQTSVDEGKEFGKFTPQNSITSMSCLRVIRKADII